MHQYTISLDGESVGVQSETDLAPVFAKWTQLLHLSGVGVGPGSECEFLLEYSNALGNEVCYHDGRAHITMPLAEFGSGELLLYAALPFLEVLHQRRSVVTMHAAAVELDGEAILLLGKSGSGKTMLTLSLCRNHGARLIGNDIVQVGLRNGEVTANQGSKYFFLRQESIKRNIPELLSLFPQSEKDPWTHKIYCLPKLLGIDTCTVQPPITRSYLVHVDETMEHVYTTGADKMDTRLYLHENMSRYIRGTAIALFGEGSRFMGYVPSYDTPGFFAMRTVLIEKLISDAKTTYVAGSLHQTCQHIVSGMEV